MKNVWPLEYLQHHYGKINDYYVIIDKQIKVMINSITNKLNISKATAGKTMAKLDTLSPLKTLTRGYCLTQINGKVIKSANELRKRRQNRFKIF